MELGEKTISVAEHIDLGAVAISIFSQPEYTPPEVVKDSDTELLRHILMNVEMISSTLGLIYSHITRPPWYTRLWRRIKNVALFR